MSKKNKICYQFPEKKSFCNSKISSLTQNYWAHQRVLEKFIFIALAIEYNNRMMYTIFKLKWISQKYAALLKLFSDLV